MIQTTLILPIIGPIIGTIRIEGWHCVWLDCLYCWHGRHDCSLANACRPYKVVWIRIISGIVGFACISQPRTLKMFDTKYCHAFGCKLGWGGILSIVTAVIWLIGAVLVLLIPKAVIRNENGAVQVAVKESVQVTETIQADRADLR